MTTTLPKTVTATTNKDLVRLSPLFFDDAIFSIMRELVQNSRRAGATLVEIQHTPQGDKSTWSYRDNGEGCMPQDLMEFGGTCWDTRVTERETPAGIGFFSLSRRNPVVSSPKHQWSLSLHEANFQGSQADVVHLATVTEEAKQWGFLCTFDGKAADKDATGLGIYSLNHFWYTLTACCGMVVSVNGKQMPSVENFMEVDLPGCVKSDTVQVLPGIQMRLFAVENSSGDRCTSEALLGNTIYTRLPINKLSVTPYGWHIFARIKVDREELLPLELPQRNKFIESENLASLQQVFRHMSMDLRVKVSKGDHIELDLKTWETLLSEQYAGAIQLPHLLGRLRPEGNLDSDDPETWNFSTSTSHFVSFSEMKGLTLLRYSGTQDDYLLQLKLNLFKPAPWFQSLLYSFTPLEEQYPAISAKFPEWMASLQKEVDQVLKEPDLVLEVTDSEGDVRGVEIDSGWDNSELFYRLGEEEVVTSMQLKIITPDKEEIREVDCLWDVTDYETVDDQWHVTRGWLEGIDVYDFTRLLYSRFSDNISSEDEDDMLESISTLEGVLFKHQSGSVKEWVVGQLKKRLHNLRHDVPQLDELLDTHRLAIYLGGKPGDRELSISLTPQVGSGE